MKWIGRKEKKQVTPEARTAPEPRLRVCEQDQRAALKALEHYARTNDVDVSMSRFRLFRKGAES